MLRSVLWQTRGAWRRDGVRTSWSLGTAVPGLDGARCAVGGADPRPAACLPAGGGLVAERNPRRTLTFSTRSVGARALSLPWSACTAPTRRLTLRAAPAQSHARVPHPHAAGAEGGLRRCGQRRCAPSPRPAARLCLVSAAGVLGLRRRRRLRAWRASCYEAVGRKGSRRLLQLYEMRPMDGQRCTECDDGATDQCPAPGQRAARRRPWRLRRRGRPGGPRGLPSLHEGSGHGQPEQRRREGRPAPAARMAVLFSAAGRGVSRANCRTLQPVWHRAPLGPRATTRPRRP